MAAQLVHLGLGFATDEMVAVDADCSVEAVRQPLKLRQGAKAHCPYLESLVILCGERSPAMFPSHRMRGCGSTRAVRTSATSSC